MTMKELDSLIYFVLQSERDGFQKVPLDTGVVMGLLLLAKQQMENTNE